MKDALTIALSKGLEAIIDVDDLVLAEEHVWHAMESKGQHYAATSIFTRSGPRTTRHRAYLHRLILGAGKNHIVRFKNGDTLDCRRSNLRLVRRTRGGR